MPIQKSQSVRQWILIQGRGHAPTLLPTFFICGNRIRHLKSDDYRRHCQRGWHMSCEENWVDGRV